MRHKSIPAIIGGHIINDAERVILGTNNNEGKTRGEIKAKRKKINREKLRQFLAPSDEKTKRMMQSYNKKGVSNWLTNLPITEHGYELMKQEFWDTTKIRYNWLLDEIPSQCICEVSFDVTHALFCKNSGLITLRHNEVRNITSELSDEVCVNARKEPILQKVNDEDFPRGANKSKEARLDISALNFSMTGQRAFFEVRVFDLFAQT